MSSFKMKVTGVEKLKESLINKRKRARSDLRDVINQIGNLALKMIKEKTPVKTGTTRDLWFKSVKTLSSEESRGEEVTIDHPFNVSGAVHPVNGMSVNNGSFSLLAEMEFGSSKREPSAMVRTTVAALTKIFELKAEKIIK